MLFSFFLETTISSEECETELEKTKNKTFLFDSLKNVFNYVYYIHAFIEMFIYNSSLVCSLSM